MRRHCLTGSRGFARLAFVCPSGPERADSERSFVFRRPGLSGRRAGTLLLKDAGRVSGTAATDEQAFDAFTLLARTEGIIPRRTSHAIAEAVRLAATMKPDQNILVCCSGRGDKDVEEASRLLALQELDKLFNFEQLKIAQSIGDRAR